MSGNHTAQSITNQLATSSMVQTPKKQNLLPSDRDSSKSVQDKESSTQKRKKWMKSLSLFSSDDESSDEETFLPKNEYLTEPGEISLRFPYALISDEDSNEEESQSINHIDINNVKDELESKKRRISESSHCDKSVVTDKNKQYKFKKRKLIDSHKSNTSRSVKKSLFREKKEKFKNRQKSIKPTTDLNSKFQCTNNYNEKLQKSKGSSEKFSQIAHNFFKSSPIKNRSSFDKTFIEIDTPLNRKQTNQLKKEQKVKKRTFGKHKTLNKGTTCGSNVHSSSSNQNSNKFLDSSSEENKIKSESVRTFNKFLDSEEESDRVKTLNHPKLRQTHVLSTSSSDSENNPHVQKLSNSESDSSLSGVFIPRKRKRKRRVVQTISSSSSRSEDDQESCLVSDKSKPTNLKCNSSSTSRSICSNTSADIPSINQKVPKINKEKYCGSEDSLNGHKSKTKFTLPHHLTQANTSAWKSIAKAPLRKSKFLSSQKSYIQKLKEKLAHSSAPCVELHKKMHSKALREATTSSKHEENVFSESKNVQILDKGQENHPLPKIYENDQIYTTSQCDQKNKPDNFNLRKNSNTHYHDVFTSPEENNKNTRPMNSSNLDGVENYTPNKPSSDVGLDVTESPKQILQGISPKAKTRIAHVDQSKVCNQPNNKKNGQLKNNNHSNLKKEIIIYENKLQPVKMFENNGNTENNQKYGQGEMTSTIQVNSSSHDLVGNIMLQMDKNIFKKPVNQLKRPTESLADTNTLTPDASSTAQFTINPLLKYQNTEKECANLKQVSKSKSLSRLNQDKTVQKSFSNSPLKPNYNPCLYPQSYVENQNSRSLEKSAKCGSFNTNPSSFAGSIPNLDFERPSEIKLRLSNCSEQVLICEKNKEVNSSENAHKSNYEQAVGKEKILSHSLNDSGKVSCEKGKKEANSSENVHKSNYEQAAGKEKIPSHSLNYSEKVSCEKSKQEANSSENAHKSNYKQAVGEEKVLSISLSCSEKGSFEKSKEDANSSKVVYKSNFEQAIDREKGNENTGIKHKCLTKETPFFHCSKDPHHINFSSESTTDTYPQPTRRYETNKVKTSKKNVSPLKTRKETKILEIISDLEIETIVNKDGSTETAPEAVDSLKKNSSINDGISEELHQTSSISENFIPELVDEFILDEFPIQSSTYSNQQTNKSDDFHSLETCPLREGEATCLAACEVVKQISPNENKTTPNKEPSKGIRIRFGGNVYRLSGKDNSEDNGTSSIMSVSNQNSAIVETGNISNDTLGKVKDTSLGQVVAESLTHNSSGSSETSSSETSSTESSSSDSEDEGRLVITSQESKSDSNSSEDESVKTTSENNKLTNNTDPQRNKKIKNLPNQTERGVLSERQSEVYRPHLEQSVVQTANNVVENSVSQSSDDDVIIISSPNEPEEKENIYLSKPNYTDIEKTTCETKDKLIPCNDPSSNDRLFCQGVNNEKKSNFSSDLSTNVSNVTGVGKIRVKTLKELGVSFDGPLPENALNNSPNTNEDNPSSIQTQNANPESVGIEINNDNEVQEIVKPIIIARQGKHKYLIKTSSQNKLTKSALKANATSESSTTHESRAPNIKVKLFSGNKSVRKTELKESGAKGNNDKIPKTTAVMNEKGVPRSVNNEHSSEPATVQLPSHPLIPCVIVTVASLAGNQNMSSESAASNLQNTTPLKPTDCSIQNNTSPSTSTAPPLQNNVPLPSSLKNSQKNNSSSTNPEFSITTQKKDKHQTILPQNKKNEDIAEETMKTVSRSSLAQTNQRRTDIELLFFKLCDELFTEVVYLKIPKLAVDLHLIIVSDMSREELLKKVHQLKFIETINEEKKRKEKEFNEMLRIRGQGFVPLFMTIVNKIEKVNLKTLVTALYCRIVHQLIQIDPANRSYICKLRHLIRKMLQKSNEKPEIINIFDQNDEDFIKNYFFVEHLLLNYDTYKSVTQKNNQIDKERVETNVPNVAQADKTISVVANVSVESESATLRTNKDQHASSSLQTPSNSASAVEVIEPRPPVGNLDQMLLGLSSEPIE